jgi:hypothetical protein
MHYGDRDFAIDKKKPTIKALGNFKINENKDLSRIDILEIRMLYKCTGIFTYYILKIIKTSITRKKNS